MTTKSNTVKRPKRLNPTLNGLIWVSPWIIGFVAFLALPIVLSLYYSLCDYPLLGLPVFEGIENYKRMAGDTVFWTSVKNTLGFAAAVIPLTTVFSVIIAVMMNAGTRGQTVHRAIIFLPTLMPIVASSVIWMWMFNGDVGLINKALRAISFGAIQGPNWLISSDWAMPALIFMSVWSVGQAVVIYLASLQDVPASLYEAADIDGVGTIGRFRHVTLPMISPVILFNVIMGIIGALQVFAVPYIMTGGGPGDATLFTAMYIYDQAFRFRDMGYANALAWVQTIFVLFLTALVFIGSKRLVFYQGAEA